MSQLFPEYKTVAVDSLIPYAKNSRTHSAAQISKIAASIKEFGFLNPVIVDGSSGIIAGHGRILAAKQLGMTEVPVVEASHLTEAQRRAYVIADNRLALDAGWDDAILKVEIGELQGLGFDLKLTGFDLVEIKGLLDSNAGQADPDDVPEVPEVPVSVQGDVWLLGRHRIICGSSTEAATVTKVLAGAAPHLMVTDPPYGVEYDASWRDGRLNEETGIRTGKVGSGDIAGRAKGKVLNDDRADWSEAWALFPGDVAYVWCASLLSPIVAESLQSDRFILRSLIIWDKTRLAISRSDYHWQHEPCWYAVRKGKKGHWSGDRKQTTVWPIPHRKSETGHSTQKPVECMKRPIENNSKPGDGVYEPFSGSGTTIIAAEMTGRCCFAIELNEAYVDMAVMRWQAFAGQTATLEGDGRTFEEIKAARA